jgi:acetyl-CoA carboxylase carboxyltransferase component
MQHLVRQVQGIEARLRQGGGAERIAKQHRAGKLTARERIEKLLDRGSTFVEVGLLVAYDLYDGKAPAAGVVTGVGVVSGRPVCVLANDSTVKAGAWWPETVPKMIRMQEIAMRCRIPIVYLVDSSGINLPFQESIFPGQYGGARIFYNNSLMRRVLKVPQIAAVMGPCIAGGAYLPALSDAIIMVEGTSFMGLGGPNLVKGAIGKSVDAESLGGAAMHTETSGVAHHKVKGDQECIDMIRAMVSDLPREPEVPLAESSPPLLDEAGIEAVLPADHRLPYDMQEVLFRVVDREGYLEFMADFAPEVLCANAHVEGRPVGVIANRRGFVRGAKTRVGAVLYTESARKVSQFVELCDRRGVALVYLQDVTGFMVGPEAEQSGIIRAGAEMVETMACTAVPKIVVTLSHASGAGYYAMAGQGFDPDFIFSWPTARVGVMEGESAVQAMFAAELGRLEQQGEDTTEDLKQAMDRTRADYERCLDAKWSAARGHVDAMIDPRETRNVLSLCLRAAAHARPLIQG